MTVYERVYGFTGLQVCGFAGLQPCIILAYLATSPSRSRYGRLRHSFSVGAQSKAGRQGLTFKVDSLQVYGFTSS